jgi:hypothetical protein
MWTKLVAGTLFLAFLFFVNLAAVVAGSFNRAETSAIASIATIFQIIVDVGAIIVVGFVGIRMFVHMVNQAELANRRYDARKVRSTVRPAGQAQAQPFEPVNFQGWNSNAPLPFEDHSSGGYGNQPILQRQPINVSEPQQGMLVQNIHRMRQQRGGYRMVK